MNTQESLIKVVSFLVNAANAKIQKIYLAEATIQSCFMNTCSEKFWATFKAAFFAKFLLATASVVGFIRKQLFRKNEIQYLRLTVSDM